MLHQFGQRRHLLGHGHLGQRDDEVGWHLAAAGIGQRGDGQVQRADGALVALQRERLDADAAERRQRAGSHSLGQLLADGDGVEVLFLVGAVAVAVLEVDAVVLHRLALQLLAHACVDGVGHPGRLVGATDRVRVVLDHLRQMGDLSLAGRQRLRARQPQRPGKHDEVGRVGVQVAQRDAAQLGSGVRLEEMRAAVDGMHRLAGRHVAGIVGAELLVGRLDALRDAGDALRREGQFHG